MMQRKTPSVEKIQVKTIFRYVMDMEERNLQRQAGFAKLPIKNSNDTIGQDFYSPTENEEQSERMVKP